MRGLLKVALCALMETMRCWPWSKMNWHVHTLATIRLKRIKIRKVIVRNTRGIRLLPSSAYF